MASIHILPDELNLTIVEGNALPPITITYIDANEDPITAFVPVMKAVNPKGEEKASFAIGSGITKDSGSNKITLDLTNSLSAACFRHYLNITVQGITNPFTTHNGNLNIVKPWQQSGGMTPRDFTYQLPIVPSVATPGSYIMNTDGANVQNTDGENIENN